MRRSTQSSEWRTPGLMQMQIRPNLSCERPIRSTCHGIEDCLSVFRPSNTALSHVPLNLLLLHTNRSLHIPTMERGTQEQSSGPWRRQFVVVLIAAFLALNSALNVRSKWISYT
jgi:hypothetical protein